MPKWVDIAYFPVAAEGPKSVQDQRLTGHICYKPWNRTLTIFPEGSKKGICGSLIWIKNNS